MGKIENNGKNKLLFLGKVHIGGIIECLTGLHIGDSDDSIKIGGIDKFVIKNPFNKKPYIPGSSLKGRARALLEKSFGKVANKKSDKIFRYEAEDINIAIIDEVCRIFGSSAEDSSKMNFPSRLIVRDCNIIGEYGTDYVFEKKSENVIDRISGQAMPRTNERVTAGAKFKLDADYNVEVILYENNNILLGNGGSDYWEILEEDLNRILDAFALIEATYLGGNGSRGYGKVKFSPSFTSQTKDEITSNSKKEENKQSYEESRKSIPIIVKKFKDYFEGVVKDLAVAKNN